MRVNNRRKSFMLVYMLIAVLALPACTTAADQTPTNAPTQTQDVMIATPPLQESATNTSLPPLPDFGEILGFGAGGGGGAACMGEAVFPPPVVYAQRGDSSGHVAELCVFGIALPANASIHLTLTSPDKMITVQGDFRSGEIGSAYWLGFENYESYTTYANCNEKTCSDWGIEFWWPTNLPDGVWQVRLSWEGGEALGSFDTTTYASLPEISVYDALAQTAIHPSRILASCHPVASGKDLMVVGRGFPANAVVYVPVFEQEQSTLYTFLAAQAFTADENGIVSGTLTGTFESGKEYRLFGVTDATLPLVAPNEIGLVDPSSLNKDAIDCFMVP